MRLTALIIYAGLGALGFMGYTLFPKVLLAIGFAGYIGVLLFYAIVIRPQLRQ